MAYATGTACATGFSLSELALHSGFDLGALLQAGLQKELLMRIYSTENSEEPNKVAGFDEGQIALDRLQANHGSCSTCLAAISKFRKSASPSMPARCTLLPHQA